MKDYIRDKYGRNADARDLVKHFGVNPGGHLPDRHMEVFVEGFRLVLLTRAEARALGYTLIRTFEECSRCHELIPAGRIHQHFKVHREVKQKYLEDATSFVGHPLKKQPKKYYPDHTEKCPVCHGHGGWNLRLDAYGPGQHFDAHCFQCAGWGWVAPGPDATCVHDFQDYAVPAGHRSGIHQARCTKCGRETSYDTSD